MYERHLYRQTAPSAQLLYSIVGSGTNTAVAWGSSCGPLSGFVNRVLLRHGHVCFVPDGRTAKLQETQLAKPARACLGQRRCSPPVVGWLSSAEVPPPPEGALTSQVKLRAPLCVPTCLILQCFPALSHPFTFRFSPRSD